MDSYKTAQTLASITNLFLVYIEPLSLCAAKIKYRSKFYEHLNIIVKTYNGNFKIDCLLNNTTNLSLGKNNNILQSYMFRWVITINMKK